MSRGAQFLVTGGTGFIGRFVVRALLKEGSQVRVLCRDEAKARRLFGEAVNTVRGDLLNAADCQNACRGVETVIHLGGVYRFGRRYRSLLEATNRLGTENVLQAACDNRIERIVHISSASVLNSRSGPITESDFPGDVPRAQSYRHSKWLGECVALDWARRGLPVMIASPTAPIGPEDEAPTPTGAMVLDFLQGRFPFSAHTMLNILNVADLAEGIVTVARRGQAGQRYLLGHYDLSLSEFLSELAQCSGRKSPRVCLPWGIVAVAGMIGEASGSNRVCLETAAHARKRAVYSCRKAAADLGWQPTRPLQQTVSEAVAWFRQSRTSPGLINPELSVRTNVADS
jgi:dihydroflavonol-4-reductase